MTFELETRGEGAPVLFLPGSYSTPRAWAGMFERLNGWHLVSVSLPGYGTTRERRDPEDCRMADLTGFVADVAAEIGEPFHIVGHSFGGQIALAAALEGRLPILSLVSFEANPIYARPGGASFPWRQETDAMFASFAQAVAAGDPEAPGLIIDYWSAPGVFAAMPPAIRDFCAMTAATNLLDWKAAQDFTPLLRDFSSVDIPCTICRGGLANQAIRDISDGLVEALPLGRLEVVEGADHFLISTHPDHCAGIVAEHLRLVQGGAVG